MLGIPPLVYLLHPHLKRFKPCFDVLGMQGAEVAALYLVFRTIPSKYKMHEYVEIADAMAYFKVGENMFLKKAFNSLNFEGETLYDLDGDGMLNAREADVMLQQIYGKNFDGDRTAQILTKKVTELGREGVTQLFFVEFCKRHPELLQPAQKNIDLLVKGSLGTKRWQRMSDNRKVLTKDKFMTIWEIIVKIQEKAGDESDMFNVRVRVAERAASEQKRLKQKYSREYLQRESSKKVIRIRSGGGGVLGAGMLDANKVSGEEEVLLAMAMSHGAGLAATASTLQQLLKNRMAVTKAKPAKFSPSKGNLVVPSN